MKVSIIILNVIGSNNLERLIQSIIIQNYADFEIIIIDFNSNAINPIFTKYQTHILGVIPVFDSLMFDSINLAIDLSTGKLISILCSDDYFKNNNAFNQIVGVFEDSKIEVCYNTYNERNKSTQKTDNKQTLNLNLYKKDTSLNINHFFFRDDIFVRYGKFNLGLPTSAFYELILRFICKHRLSVYSLKKEIIEDSNHSILNNQLSNKEFKLCWKINKLEIPVITKFIYRFRLFNSLRF